MSEKLRTVPEFFCTTVRKVEPVGGDCLRIYCSIERNGAWDDRFTVLIPITAALASSRFVIEAAIEISNESNGASGKAH